MFTWVFSFIILVFICFVFFCDFFKHSNQIDTYIFYINFIFKKTKIFLSTWNSVMFSQILSGNVFLINTYFSQFWSQIRTLKAIILWSLPLSITVTSLSSVLYIIFTIIGNGIGNQSSNPGQGWLHFTSY